jgi:ABC-type transport system substrate-binding protein
MSAGVRFTGAIAALLIAASGCAGQTASAPNELPFAAGAYPVEAAAVCELDEAGAPKPGLARIDAPDERTVVFELCAPDPSFLQKLTAAPNGIQDSGYLLSASVSGDILSKPNGTGPLRVTSTDD